MGSFDLTLELTASEGGKSVGGHLEYNEDIISRKRAESLMESFQVCLPDRQAQLFCMCTTRFCSYRAQLIDAQLFGGMVCTLALHSCLLFVP